MLDQLFSDPKTLVWMRRVRGSRQLEAFASDLIARGFSRKRAQDLISGTASYLWWASDIGLKLRQLDERAVEKFRLHLDTQGRKWRYDHMRVPALVGADHFRRLLIERGILKPRKKAEHPVLREYSEWAQAQRGLRQETIDSYLRFALRPLVTALGRTAAPLPCGESPCVRRGACPIAIASDSGKGCDGDALVPPVLGHDRAL